MESKENRSEAERGKEGEREKERERGGGGGGGGGGRGIGKVSREKKIKNISEHGELNDKSTVKEKDEIINNSKT